MRVRNHLLILPLSGILLLANVSLKAQEIVAEPNLQLFTVLAAINAAGYDAAADKVELSPLRAVLRRELAERNIPSLSALREFYQSHRLADPAQDLSQYVSLALFLSVPPSFAFQQSPANLPPEVLDLQEMVPLIASFYQEADIPALWAKYLPAMEEESERYRKLLSGVIQEIDGYLRVDLSGYWNHRFAIYVSPLGAPNLTHARNYGYNYFIVVGPAAQMPEDELRHGWLHYLLDTYPSKYPKVIESKAELQQITQRATGLDAAFRNSFSLLLTESLIRAIQARRSNLGLQAKRRAVDEAVEEGFLLTAYFFEAMEVFEGQPVGMRLYYPEMIEAIAVKKEQERLAKVQFRAQAPKAAREVQWSSLDQMARLGEQSLAKEHYEEAREIFESLSKQYGAQARVLYGLALVASQEKQPQVAKQYFAQAASLSSDPRTKAWSHIYLGRLLDVEGDRKAALAEYTAALASGDPSPDTRAAAEKGTQEGFSPPSQPGTLANDQEQEEKRRDRVPLGKEER